MRWNELGKFLVIALAIIGGFCVYISPLANSIKQGLDLQGGTHVVLQAVDTPDLKVDDDAVNRSVKIIERRVNELGLTEPVIQRQGKDRIIVELPGVKDPEKAIAMLGRTAMLQFKDINGKVVMTGKDLKDARAQVSQGNQAVVGLEFSDEGGKKFADLTARNVGKQIAIVLDGEVLTAPVVQEAITGGRAQISGSRSVEEAEHLAILLRSAMDAGFSRAIITILDSNITTLMAAAVLFYLGTGPIKGFAVTLALGTLLSMFTAVTVTKFLMRFLVYSNITKSYFLFGAKAPEAKEVAK